MHSLIQLLTVSSAPTLTINTLREEDVLPIGFNVTVTCTSNTSKDGISDPIYDMPYWMQIYFGHDSRLITIGQTPLETRDSRSWLLNLSNQFTKENTGAKQTTRMAGKDHLLQNWVWAKVSCPSFHRWKSRKWIRSRKIRICFGVTITQFYGKELQTR